MMVGWENRNEIDVTISGIEPSFDVPRKRLEFRISGSHGISVFHLDRNELLTAIDALAKP
jgi:hypothetical protein